MSKEIANQSPTADRRAARRRTAVALSLALVAAGVGAAAILWSRRPTVLVPVYRFVDPSLRDGAPASRQPAGREDVEVTPALVATIQDETRYVLSAPLHGVVLTQKDVLAPETGMLPLSVPLMPPLAGAQRIAIVPQIRQGEHWTPQPVGSVPVQREEVGRLLRFDLPLPADSMGKSIDIHIEGYAIPAKRLTSYRTSEVEIPSGSVLEVGVGILLPAWGQGPVEFEAKACAGNNCDTVFRETVDPSTEAGQQWVDRSVPLERLSGSRRAFVFETRPVSESGSFSFPVWANPTLYASQRRASDAPNVVLLSIDTLRADHLTPYGYQHDTSPFMEQTFGRHGTVFEHCVAASATTPPSHMTMFTSVPPCMHGLKTGLEVLQPGLTTLAETLRAAHFETGAVTEDGWLGIQQGFGRGFNAYAENKSPDIMAPQGQVDATFRKAKEWLARNRDKRFFLFLHTFQVHDPYTPPARYNGLFASHDGQPTTEQSPRYRRDMASYDREIRYTDDELGKLFQTLNELGLGENTIFILTSDHGEEFFEHGLWGHGAHLYEEATRVPLLVWGPGRVSAGHRVSEPVGLIDLMPTILDVAGVAASRQTMGVSFAPRLRAETAAAPEPPRLLFSEAWGHLRVLPGYRPEDFDSPAYMVQSGLRKMQRYRDGERFSYETYDLTADPGERRNLYDPGDAQQAAMQAGLDTYENTCRLALMKLALENQAALAETPSRAHLDPAQEEKLRALGYLH